MSRYFANITEAVAVTDREIEFRFDQKGNRELPQSSATWWCCPSIGGKARTLPASSATISADAGKAPRIGPYQIESFKPGSEIVWTRVKDYWAAKLPVRVGRVNFDRRKYVYFQDENAAWQVHKGGFSDFRGENPGALGEEYTFPAFKAGDVIKSEFADFPASRCRALC